MKKLLTILLIAIFAFLAASEAQEPNADYIVLSWNDLGMHCSNKDFSNIVILPPYNNLMAQVIKRGDANNMPQIITHDVEIRYSFATNTYSVGKTNFWDYEHLIFGVNLEDNIGLKGKGLAGVFDLKDGYFIAEGIPITPFPDNDLLNEDPYQQALVKLYYKGEEANLTVPVVPVSNEISCVSSGCHPSENHIINEHTDEGGFDRNKRPILCANCHGSNALGMPGHSNLGSLSQVIHREHGSRTNDCYKCHPGPKTKCFRDIMFQNGKVCQDCHGSVSEVGQSIKNGRKPWLEEPKCGSCHDSKHSEEQGKLFRQSRGHAGLFCSACHGSPHAIVPTVVDRDNEQNFMLQGHIGKLDDCTVCHGVIPKGPGPHGFNPLSAEDGAESGFAILKAYPNPAKERLNLSLKNDKYASVKVKIFDAAGKLVMIAYSGAMEAGEKQINADVSKLPPGYYTITFEKKGAKAAAKFVKK